MADADAVPSARFERIDRMLESAKQAGLERLDSQLLLLHALGVAPQEAHARRAWLIASGEHLATGDQVQRFADLVHRRLRGEPLAYLVGYKEFMSLGLRVDRRVLVPRPDTETLVEWALERLAQLPRGARVLDLGTGSGAIALAIKHARPDARVHAADRSRAALAVARDNASAHGLSICFHQGDWLAATDGRFDLIVSNPPYVAAGDPHLAQLSDEPAEALSSGADGLDDIRWIVSTAGHHLEPGGLLMLEHGWDQGPQVRALLVEAGFRQVCTRKDLGDRDRCSAGAWDPRIAVCSGKVK